MDTVIVKHNWKRADREVSELPFKISSKWYRGQIKLVRDSSCKSKWDYCTGRSSQRIKKL